MRLPETAFDQLPDEFLHCRDVRHSWSVQTGWQTEQVTVRKKARRCITRTLVCSVCGVERTDFFDLNFDRVALSYNYVEGYHVPKTDLLRGARGARIAAFKREVQQ